jgi:hypothetical protein
LIFQQLYRFLGHDGQDTGIRVIGVGDADMPGQAPIEAFDGLVACKQGAQPSLTLLLNLREGQRKGKPRPRR